MTEKTYQTTLLIRGDSKNAVKHVKLTRGELEKLTGAQAKNATVTQRLGAAFTKTNKSVGRATSSFHGLGAVIGVLGLGKLVSETIQAADTYASLQGQLKLVTDSQEELNQVYDRSLALANKTGQSTESTVKLYARMARSTEELSLSQNDLFTITEAINQSFIVSGAATQEAASATLQLSQGLAAGALRGEELNSVMENSPRLARALADGLGVGIGQLREMGAAGELTAEKVTTALLRTASDIETEFNQMPMTVSRVMQTLSNDVNDALGQVDTGPMIDAVEDLRSVISDPATTAAITDIASGLIGMTSAALEALSTMTKLTKFLAEEFAAAVHGPAVDDIPRMEDALAKLEKRMRQFIAAGGEMGGAAGKNLSKSIADMKSNLDSARKATETLTESTEEAGEAFSKTASIIDLAKESLSRSNTTIEDASRVLDKMNKSTRDLISSMEHELQLLGLTGREQAVSIALRKAGTTATSDQREEIELLAGAIYDEAEALSAATVETKKAEKAVDPFADAIVHAAERIDSAFADAWKGAFDSFSDFADGLKNAFQQLLGELLHQIFTANIGKSLFASIGIGGASAASAGGSLLSSSGGGLMSGGIAGIGTSLLGGIGNGASSLFNLVGEGSSILADLGVPGMDAL
ncbi:MAG: hypothetical protein DRR42_22670, partial [Gammaproteobacteria bacterium]